MKNKNKEINGIRYGASFVVNADCTITVSIKTVYSDEPVFQKTYATSDERAVIMAWRDWEKERAQLMANKVKL